MLVEKVAFASKKEKPDPVLRSIIEHLRLVSAAVERCALTPHPLVIIPQHQPRTVQGYLYGPYENVHHPRTPLGP